MNIFENVPVYENDYILIRKTINDDLNDLYKVYSDKQALPYFNSDNCDGDNFYYNSLEKMQNAMSFWNEAYNNGWFVRLSIIDKTKNLVVGTVELCKRVSEDFFNNTTILRVDVRSDYEKNTFLFNVFALISKDLNEIFNTKCIITKANSYADERIIALKNCGYKASNEYLIGKNGMLYGSYYTYK